MICLTVESDQKHQFNFLDISNLKLFCQDTFILNSNSVTRLNSNSITQSQERGRKTFKIYGWIEIRKKLKKADVNGEKTGLILPYSTIHSRILSCLLHNFFISSFPGWLIYDKEEKGRISRIFYILNFVCRNSTSFPL